MLPADNPAGEASLADLVLTLVVFSFLALFTVRGLLRREVSVWLEAALQDMVDRLLRLWHNSATNRTIKAEMETSTLSNGRQRPRATVKAGAAQAAGNPSGVASRKARMSRVSKPGSSPVTPDAGICSSICLVNTLVDFHQQTYLNEAPARRAGTKVVPREKFPSLSGTGIII